MNNHSSPSNRQRRALAYAERLPAKRAAQAAWNEASAAFKAARNSGYHWNDPRYQSSVDAAYELFLAARETFRAAKLLLDATGYQSDIDRDLAHNRNNPDVPEFLTLADLER